MPNRLASETSPYLLQHAHNPVDWYPWGPEALERARSEDKPIFLSIGYAACHWCHVMERESFENPEIAALMNAGFVSIKVDREERPDLDDVYMAAVQAMTGSGGWPMTVFLTPDLAPFFGGTYFPPEDRHGMSGLPRILDAVADAYRTRRTEVEAQASALADHLRAQLVVPAGTRDVEPPQLEAAVARLAATFDAAHGGFGGAPKFPPPMVLEFLLRAWRRTGDDETLRMVTRTLDGMADGGINDQLGGGFARYSTDAHWLVPHFEKMLYDNALLAHAYLEAFRATGTDRYARVARATLDFLIAELRTDDGGFASALDADSEGVEGRFYAWSYDEFIAVLSDAGLDDTDRALLADYWGVTEAGNWEGTNVVHVAGADPGDELVERGRLALLAARAERTRPVRDEKQIASWNGLALRALAHGALVLGDERVPDSDSHARRLRRGPARARRRSPLAHGPRRARRDARVRRGLPRRRGRADRRARGARRCRAAPARQAAGRVGDPRLLGRRGRDVPRHVRRARSNRCAASRARRQRHAIGEFDRGRCSPAPCPARRGGGLRAAGTLDRPCRGPGPRAPAERVRPDAVRGGPHDRRGD